MIKRLIWTIWTPMSSVLKKADKLNLSLSLSLGDQDKQLAFQMFLAAASSSINGSVCPSVSVSVTPFFNHVPITGSSWNAVCPSVCVCNAFLAATKQLYEWLSPSVCRTFFTMFPSTYHHEIFRSYYHGQKWCPCKRSRSKVKVTEVKANFDPNWAFPDSNSSLNSLMAMKWCTKLEVA